MYYLCQYENIIVLILLILAFILIEINFNTFVNNILFIKNKKNII